jgi:ferrochelatase
VVLVNLGTPVAPTPRAVRTYLAEFLADRRVIELHPALWWPILHGIILRVRPRASAQKYASIWTPEGSPLRVATRRLRDHLDTLLGTDATVHVGMRYGTPPLTDVLDSPLSQGRRQVLIVPLYPQYAASSTGSVLDAVSRWSLASRDQLELRTLRSFPTHPAYLDAVAAGVEAGWRRHGRPDFATGDRLLLSFHSIPQAMHRAGDPYRSECFASAAGIRERLQLTEDEAPLTFQSVFGPAAWLTPATIDTVRALGASGTRRVDVVCPGYRALRNQGCRWGLKLPASSRLREM